MFNEKLKYYRKKQMLSQEDLAFQLNVSRQTITKWENGLVIPGIEYLIDLSELFGVTIDSLLKNDDCRSLEENLVNHDCLADFLVQAKKETYAAKKNKKESSRLQSHDYQFQKDDYIYVDSYFGTSKFSGQEVVYEKDVPVWSMNYYGSVIGQHFDGDFLKEALKHVSVLAPYRGPQSYAKGDFHYFNDYEGDLTDFNGKEKIFYQNILIYEGLYHGGTLA